MADLLYTVDLGTKKLPRKGSEPERLRKLFEKFSRNRYGLKKHNE